MKMKWVIGLVFLVSGFCVQAQEKELSDEEQLAVLQERIKQKQKESGFSVIGDYSMQFAEGCKAFLEVFDEGTEITIERMNEFLVTPAGKVTIFFIAWKIMADDAIEITKDVSQTILGVLLLPLYLLAIRRAYQVLVTGYNVVESKEGRKKTYVRYKPEFKTADRYVGWCIVTVFGLIVATIVELVFLF